MVFSVDKCVLMILFVVDQPDLDQANRLAMDRTPIQVKFQGWTCPDVKMLSELRTERLSLWMRKDDLPSDDSNSNRPNRCLDSQILSKIVDLGISAKSNLIIDLDRFPQVQMLAIMFTEDCKLLEFRDSNRVLSSVELGKYSDFQVIGQLPRAYSYEIEAKYLPLLSNHRELQSLTLSRCHRVSATVDLDQFPHLRALSTDHQIHLASWTNRRLFLTIQGNGCRGSGSIDLDDDLVELLATASELDTFLKLLKCFQSVQLHSHIFDRCKYDADRSEKAMRADWSACTNLRHLTFIGALSRSPGPSIKQVPSLKLLEFAEIERCIPVLLELLCDLQDQSIPVIIKTGYSWHDRYELSTVEELIQVLQMPMSTICEPPLDESHLPL